MKTLTIAGIAGVVIPLITPEIVKLRNAIEDDLVQKYNSVNGIKDALVTLTDDLSSIQSWVEKLEQIIWPSNEMLDWSRRATEIRYEVDHHISEFLCEENSCTRDCMVRYRLISHVKDLKRRLNVLAYSYKSSNWDQLATSNMVDGLGCRASPILSQDNGDLLGSQAQLNELINLLQVPNSQVPNSSNSFKVISIVGSGGSGKTALALEAFNSVGDKFDICASVCVSGCLDTTSLLMDLCMQVGGQDLLAEELQTNHLIRKISALLATKRMFYFFFESRGKKEDPVVIWLTGGPGCSSELAVFYENGPFTIANNMSLAWNKFGWDTISNIIFVDQPTGTGFSYSSDDRDTRHDETGVSNDLYDFLQVFFRKHPELAKNDFYITGESYAGHYIPAFASRVHQGNKANEGIHINLKGFAIGNGLTDPEIQYKAYTDYALEMNLIEKSDYERINRFIPPCELAIKMCGTDGKASCMAAYMVCNNIFNSIMKIVGTKNYYDVRKECEGSLCYDFSNLEKFFGDKAVKEALGVGDIEFVSCSSTVYEAMLTDWMRNLEVGIPALLEDGINVLIYAGEYDLICNWLGNSRWVHSMEWSGQKDFVSSSESSFVVDGDEAGVLKSHGPLSFLKVHNAGHMVPMDQPKASLEMLRRFTQGKLKESVPEPMVLKDVM